MRADSSVVGYCLKAELPWLACTRWYHVASYITCVVTSRYGSNHSLYMRATCTRTPLNHSGSIDYCRLITVAVIIINSDTKGSHVVCIHKCQRLFYGIFDIYPSSVTMLL